RKDHERADERDRHRQQRDERRAEALEEDEDDDHDEEQRLDERLRDLADSRAHRQRRVERRHVVEVGREPRLHLLHELRRGPHRLDGIRAGQLVDRHDRGRLAVPASAPDVVLRPSSTRATSFARTSAPSGLARTTTFSKSARLVRRPCARTVYVNSWPRGTGSPPSWPAGLTVFCACRAAAISLTVMSNLASVSGLTQRRMAYCDAPKIMT